ncbi:hypothetical protein ACVIIV_007335 [Bradyrhizobium sp. USDA 4354]
MQGFGLSALRRHRTSFVPETTGTKHGKRGRKRARHSQRDKSGRYLPCGRRAIDALEQSEQAPRPSRRPRSLSSGRASRGPGGGLLRMRPISIGPAETAAAYSVLILRSPHTQRILRGAVERPSVIPLKTSSSWRSFCQGRIAPLIPNVTVEANGLSVPSVMAMLLFLSQACSFSSATATYRAGGLAPRLQREIGPLSHTASLSEFKSSLSESLSSSYDASPEKSGEHETARIPPGATAACSSPTGAERRD